MTHFDHIHAQAQHQAEEQALYLQSEYEMDPLEIIKMYSGKTMKEASINDAIHLIMDFNMAHATKQGVMVG